MSKTSDQPEPPWIKVPDVGPDWAGWRQGAAEDWLVDIWLPFWENLNTFERLLYLQKHPVPDEDWHLQLEHFWTP